MSDLLDEYEARTGHSVPIHVDGASGAFVAPFATPKLEWDFKIPRVVSINTSGHKFGLGMLLISLFWFNRLSKPSIRWSRLGGLERQEVSPKRPYL